MDTTKVIAIISLIIALSVASERLVEIVKGLIPFLNGKNPDAKKERVRRTIIHLLGVGAGVVTAFLARPAIPVEAVPAASDSTIIALGLLASGGSGFWNSVLTYMLKVKDIKEAQAVHEREVAGLPAPAE